MAGVTVLALALAGDPATPGHILRAIATHPTTTGTHLEYTLLAHPNLPDDVLPPPDPRTSFGPPFEGTASAAALDALRLPHTTARARARVLAHLSTAVLRDHIADGDPHRSALAALAARTATGNRRTDALVDLTLATHPATPSARHRAALTHLLTAPTAQHTGLLEDAALATLDLQQMLVTQALRHPTHLHRLAGVAVDAAIRGELQRYADLHATGVDVRTTHHADTRADVEARSATDPLAWARACERAADPDLADLALDSVVDARPGVAEAIVTNPALGGTPAVKRARVQLFTGWLPPAGAVLTPAGEALARIVHTRSDTDAHRLATATHPRAPRARDLLRAGWARLHRDHDPTNSLNPEALRSASWNRIIVYALHPALSSTYRHLAIELLDLGLPIGPTRATPAALPAQLARAARTPAQLHAALGTTPVWKLDRTGVDLTDHVITHHLADHLRHRHEQLTERSVAALLSLAGEFTGTVDELITTAATIST